jgi:S-adenosylmethionine synthetase
MARQNYLFTSESVSEGHPDKVCDQISDTIVDLIIGREPEARVAVETAATTNRVVLMGEVSVSEENAFSPEEICAAARETIREIGYMQKGFHFKTALIECLIHEQSPDIAQASMPPRTRTRAPATRASCSATPPTRRRSLCRRRSSIPTASCN